MNKKNIKDFIARKFPKPPVIVAPALYIASVFAAGIICAAAFGIAPIAVTIIVLLVLLLIILAFRAAPRWRNFTLLFVFFALGAARYGAYSTNPKNHYSSRKNIISVRGMICNFPENYNGRWRGTLKIMSVDCGKGFERASGKIVLYIDSPEKALAYGQVWEIKGEPYHLREEHNFFAPKYSAMLKRRGITGRMWSNGKNATLLDEDRGSPIIRELIAKIRNHIGSSISNALGGKEGALLEGILLGGGRKLPQNVKNMFSDTGVIHILAVSGLHIGIIAAILWFIFKKFFKLDLFYVAIFTMVLLIGYAFLVQLRPSVLRATIMAGFVLFAPLVHRRSSILNALGAAALFILIFRPADIFSAGFQLSFAATGGIVYFMPRLANLISEDFLFLRGFFPRAAQLFLVTIAVQIGVAPISVFHFHKFQIIAPIANLLVVPVVAPAISIGFAGIAIGAVFAPLGKLVLQSDYILLKYILIMVKYLGSLPFSYIAVARPSLFAIAGYYIAIWGLFNIPWRRAARYAAVVGIAVAIIPAAVQVRSDNAVFLNIHGTAVYFADDEGNTALVCDCVREDVNKIITPFLLGTGRRTVDLLCLPMTRANLKIIKQTPKVMENLARKKILVPKDFPDSLAGDDWVRNETKTGKLSIKFISQKNCSVELDGKKFYIYLAPMENFLSDGVRFINFPIQFMDTIPNVKNISSADTSKMLIIGYNSDGWRTFLNRENIDFADISRSPLWIRFNASSHLLIFQR